MNSSLPAGRGGVAKALPVVLTLLGVAVYANSLNAPFVLDDHAWIHASSSLRDFSNLTPILANSERPLVTLTLAVNALAGGTSVWGYHAFNTLIHCLAGLALFGVARRTFAGPSLAARFGDQAHWLAFAVAGVWLLHPLQTQAVSYTMGRSESLAGLLYLLTLYCTIRWASGERVLGWAVAGVLACALGMATSPVMLTAPLIVLVYDRSFLAGSFAGALRARGLFFGALAACWLVAFRAALGFASRTATPPSIPAADYGTSQLAVIAHYARLSLWPYPLCFDYAWPVGQSAGDVVLPALLIGALLAVSLWGLLRAPALGFLGVWFLLILVPTSSVVVRDPLAFEPRMYLPLAAPVVVAVLAARWLLQRVAAGPVAAGALLAVVLLVLGGATIRRNQDYASEIALWQSVVGSAEDNARAQQQLASAYRSDGQIDLAIVHYRRATELSPNSAEAYSNLASALRRRGDVEEAIEVYRLALEIDAESVSALTNLGNALREQGDRSAAIALYRRALEIEPNSPQTHHSMAMALAAGGHASDALAHLREAIRLRPHNPIPSGNIARLLSRAIGEVLPPSRSPNRPETPIEGAELFHSLSKQYAKISKTRLSLDADDIARKLGLARAQR